MTFTFKLERADGAPADADDQEHRHELARRRDDPVGRDRTLSVVGIVVSAEDEPSALVVEDVA